MSKRNKQRIVSLFICFSLLCTLFLSVLPVSALTSVQGLLHLTDLPAALLQTLNVSDLSAQVMTRDSLYQLEFVDESGFGQIQTFSVPIKYIDEDGNVQYINTAMESLGFFEKLFSRYDYRNAANDFTVLFSEDPTVGIEFDEDFTISLNASAVAGEGYVSTDDSGNGKWIYPQAFGEHTYVEYINTNRGIKENIILQQNIGRNTFSFTYQSDTYLPELINGGEAIRLSAPGQPEYIISPLFVYDSYTPAGEENNSTFRHSTMDCHYLLEQTGEGEYIVTYVIDPQWLNSPEVVWPVTIDPSISTSVADSDIKDTFVVQGNPNALYYGYNFMNIGNRAGDTWGTLYGYVQFNTLPTVPSGSVISDVTLELKAKGTQNTGERAACYQVTSSKNINSINWNNQPTYNSTALSYSHIKNVPLPSDTNYLCDKYVFDVTSAYNDWIANNNNYGLRIAYASAVTDYTVLHASETATATNAPKLTVNYRLFNTFAGFEDDTTYYIKNAQSGTDADLYLSVWNGDNTNVIQRYYNGTAEQQWFLYKCSDGWYELVPQNLPDHRLYAYHSVLSGTNDYDAYVQVTDNTEWQRFYPVEVEQGKFILRSKADAKRVLAADYGNTVNTGGVEVELYDPANAQSKGQLWIFESVGSTPNISSGSTYFLRNLENGKCLDYTNTQAVSDTAAYDPSQQWKIHYVGDGYYRFTNEQLLANEQTDRCLALLSFGSIACISASSIGDGAKWRLLSNGDGTYRLINKCNDSYNLVLDTSANGTTLVSNTWTGSNSQRWVLEQATLLGGAGAYYEETALNVNCFEYALKAGNYDEDNSLARPLPQETVQAYAGRLKLHIQNDLSRECRIIDSCNSLLRPNEYKVAMRLATYELYGETRNRDAHFMLQLNDGTWAHKPGRNPSQKLSITDPSTYFWEWSEGLTYNSDTIYFAVTNPE